MSTNRFQNTGSQFTPINQQPTPQPKRKMAISSLHSDGTDNSLTSSDELKSTDFDDARKSSPLSGTLVASRTKPRAVTHDMVLEAAERSVKSPARGQKGYGSQSPEQDRSSAQSTPISAEKVRKEQQKLHDIAAKKQAALLSGDTKELEKARKQEEKAKKEAQKDPANDPAQMKLGSFGFR